MRLFIAVDLSDEVKDYLFELQKSFKGYAKVNWVAKKNLHLTLKFLGDIKDEELGDVKEILKEIKFDKFKICLKGAGVFPAKNIIRVLWVGLEPVDKIMALQKKVDETLLLKFPADQRFLAHLTLGRVKLVKDKKKFLEVLEKIKVKDLCFDVNCFKLIESKLRKDGPQYTVLEKYNLV